MQSASAEPDEELQICLVFLHFQARPLPQQLTLSVAERAIHFDVHWPQTTLEPHAKHRPAPSQGARPTYASACDAHTRSHRGDIITNHRPSRPALSRSLTFVSPGESLVFVSAAKRKTNSRQVNVSIISPGVLAASSRRLGAPAARRRRSPVDRV